MNWRFTIGFVSRETARGQMAVSRETLLPAPQESLSAPRQQYRGLPNEPTSVGRLFASSQ
jgi:hypothetical protein